MFWRAHGKVHRDAPFGPGMYVIFPADELIYMTYGPAIPRFKPRPTLDNLQEPLVPIGCPPTTSPIITTNSINSLNGRDNCKTIASTPSTPNPSHVSRSRRSSSQQPPVQPASRPNPNALLPSQRPRDQRSASRSSLPPIPQTVAPQQPNHSKPRPITTDIFGYVPSSRSNYSAGSRERTPSLYSDGHTPSLLENGHTVLRPLSVADSTSNKGKPPGKSKSRLHINLGRLGRSKQTQPAEPARLRDITEIRIANPTFTRENLQQNNFDAFFESGEPVYSLEQRTPLISPVSSTDLDQLDNMEAASISSPQANRPSSLNFFQKSNKNTVTFRSRSTDIDDASVRVPQKGDRCLFSYFFSWNALFHTNRYE